MGQWVLINEAWYYTVVEAADIEAALEIAGRNPIFSLGGTIEVAEQLKF